MILLISSKNPEGRYKAIYMGCFKIKEFKIKLIAWGQYLMILPESVKKNKQKHAVVQKPKKRLSL